jgi:hypothetical protein
VLCALLPVLATALVLIAQLTQGVFIRPGLVMLEAMSEDEQELKQP